MTRKINVAHPFLSPCSSHSASRSLLCAVVVMLPTSTSISSMSSYMSIVSSVPARAMCNASAKSSSSYPSRTLLRYLFLLRLFVGLPRPKPHTKSGWLSTCAGMARLEASKRVCSADLHRDALELALVLEQLADLFFAAVRRLVQPADDVAHERLDHEWCGAVHVEA